MDKISIVETHPELLKEWDYEKNGDLLPEHVTEGAGKKVWWKCSKGHEWQAFVYSRAGKQKNGCPYCSNRRIKVGYNDLTTTNPLLALEWHPSKNFGLEPVNITCGSNKKVWWLCSQNHEYQATVSDRNSGKGCPFCSNKEVLVGYNDLTTTNPQLASEWHPSKNGDLKPTMFTKGSGRKVWWKCSKEHEWQASIHHRNNGTGCPICSCSLLLQGFNDLATVNPEIASEWHPVKNGNITPNMVMPSSNKDAWWLGKCGHEWYAKISQRNLGNGCPYCSNHKVLEGFNDLQTLRPDLASEWHPTKNGDITPQSVVVGSNKHYWWFCKNGHEWRATLSNRSKDDGTGCPYCNSQTSFAEQAILYYITRDTDFTVESRAKIPYEGKTHGIEVDIYLPSKKIGIEYDGMFWHSGKDDDELIKQKQLKELGIKLYRVKESNENLVLEDTIFYKFSKNSIRNLNWAIIELEKKLNIFGLHIDVNKDKVAILELYHNIEKSNSIAIKYPHLVPEWNVSRNGSLSPENFNYGSNISVWWKCSLGHEWKTNIGNRTVHGKGCPYCKNQKVLVGFNDLQTLNPQLAEQWDYDENGDTLPSMIGINSRKRIWWKCQNGHKWQSAVYSRTEGAGCPYCSGRKAIDGKNDVLTLFPELLKEWHYVKNKAVLPDSIKPGSSKKVWWICNQGHEYQATVCDRTHGSNCPYCSNKRVLEGYNDLVTTNYSLSLEWHPTKNGDLYPTQVTKSSGKKVWWLGSCGHEWIAEISNRNNGTGCPICANQQLLEGFNDLKTFNPKIALEWHPTKNGNLLPNGVIYSSGKKVWWLCKNGHEWETKICNRSIVRKGRTAESGCPYCKNKKVLTGYNDLVTKFPEIAKQWNYDKNDILPNEVIYSSDRKVWWVCENNHEWQTSVEKRTIRKQGCPKCRNKFR